MLLHILKYVLFSKLFFRGDSNSFSLLLIDVIETLLLSCNKILKHKHKVDFIALFYAILDLISYS